MVPCKKEEWLHHAANCLKMTENVVNFSFSRLTYGYVGKRRKIATAVVFL